VLKANTQVAGQRLNLSRKQLTLDISNTYEEMVYSQEKLRWLQRQDSVLRRYVDVASTRYQAGEARQLEPLTAYKLQRENLLTIKQVQDEYQLLQLQLMSLINSPEPVVPADQQLLMMAPPAADYNFAATSEGQLMASELLQAATQVKEAKTGYLPHINLGLRHQLVFSGWDPYKLHRAKFADGNFMGFEIGVGIPLFYGATKAKVKAARKEQEVVGLRRQQAELQQSQQILALQKRYASALERLRIYQDKGLGEAAEVARIAQAAYESGDIGYVEYVNSLQESLSTRMAYIDALHQYNQAVIQWQHSLR
jgi:cobalt-zinc-cadmium resistance protein CzcA